MRKHDIIIIKVNSAKGHMTFTCHEISSLSPIQTNPCAPSSHATDFLNLLQILYIHSLSLAICVMKKNCLKVV